MKRFWNVLRSKQVVVADNFLNLLR